MTSSDQHLAEWVCVLVVVVIAFWLYLYLRDWARNRDRPDILAPEQGYLRDHVSLRRLK